MITDILRDVGPLLLVIGGLLGPAGGFDCDTTGQTR